MVVATVLSQLRAPGRHGAGRRGGGTVRGRGRTSARRSWPHPPYGRCGADGAAAGRRMDAHLAPSGRQRRAGGADHRFGRGAHGAGRATAPAAAARRQPSGRATAYVALLRDLERRGASATRPRRVPAEHARRLPRDGRGRSGWTCWPADYELARFVDIGLTAAEHRRGSRLARLGGSCPQPGSSGPLGRHPGRSRGSPAAVGASEGARGATRCRRLRSPLSSSEGILVGRLGREHPLDVSISRPRCPPRGPPRGPLLTEQLLPLV